MRSARSITNPMSCSTSSTDMPPSRKARSSAASRCFSMWRRPAAGSSSSSSIGSTHSARAISTMRCWPSESEPASASIWSESPTRSICRAASASSLASSARSSRSMLAERTGMAAQMRADRDVFQHRHVRHQLDVLERAGDAEFCHFLRWRVVDAPAEHGDLAAGLGEHAGDQVEGRALAGAVRADQRDDLAGLDVERDVVDGDHAAELFSRVIDLQQHRGGAGLARSRRAAQASCRAACGPA